MLLQVVGGVSSCLLIIADAVMLYNKCIREQLALEKVIVSAPFSFVGSAQRIWKITNVDNAIAKLILALLAIGLIL